MDYDFTARLEDDLDRIAAGDEERVEWLKRFYFGDGDPGLHALVTDHLEGIDAREVNSIAIPGSDIVVRVGRYGPYLERGDERASVPDDLAPDELTAERAEELLATPAGAERSLGTHPETGRDIAVRVGRYGPYVTEVLPEGADDKPRTASLFTTMSPETVTLEEARAPPLAAAHARGLGRRGDRRRRTGGTARSSRRGPRRARSSPRSSSSRSRRPRREAILAQPKQRRGRGAAEAAAHASSGPIRRAASRSSSRTAASGPYVTDGETNASLRRGDDVDGADAGTCARAARRAAREGPGAAPTSAPGRAADTLTSRVRRPS